MNGHSNKQTREYYLNTKNAYFKLKNALYGSGESFIASSIIDIKTNAPCSFSVCKAIHRAINSGNTYEPILNQCNIDTECTFEIEFETSRYKVTGKKTISISNTSSMCQTISTQPPPIDEPVTDAPAMDKDKNTCGTKILDNLYLAGVYDYPNAPIKQNTTIVSFINIFEYAPKMMIDLEISVENSHYTLYVNQLKHINVFIINGIEDDHKNTTDIRMGYIANFEYMIYDDPLLCVASFGNLIYNNINTQFYINCFEGRNRSVTYLISILIGNKKLLKQFCDRYLITDHDTNILRKLLSKITELRDGVWNSQNDDLMGILERVASKAWP